MAEEFYRKLIIKELKGGGSPEESEMVNQWINENPENRKIYQDLWTAYQLTAPDVEQFIPEKEMAWARIKSKITLPHQQGSWFLQFSKIAAAAILFFLIGIAFQQIISDAPSSDFLTNIQH